MRSVLCSQITKAELPSDGFAGLGAQELVELPGVFDYLRYVGFIDRLDHLGKRYQDYRRGIENPHDEGDKEEQTPPEGSFFLFGLLLRQFVLKVFYHAGTSL